MDMPSPLEQPMPSRRMLFISGRISLDLSHTGGKRTEQGAYFEQLHHPEDLTRWLARCELALENIIVDDNDLELAHELREAIWYAAHAVAYGKPIEGLDRGIINRFAAFETLIMQLDEAGGPYWRQPVTAKAVLSYIARDAVNLLGTDAKHRLRECANPQCPLLFVDTSRPNKRRWCSMERCGLIEKTARFRTKAKREQRNIVQT